MGHSRWMFTTSQLSVTDVLSMSVFQFYLWSMFRCVVCSKWLLLIIVYSWCVCIVEYYHWVMEMIEFFEFVCMVSWVSTATFLKSCKERLVCLTCFKHHLFVWTIENSSKCANLSLFHRFFLLHVDFHLSYNKLIKKFNFLMLIHCVSLHSGMGFQHLYSS